MNSDTELREFIHLPSGLFTALGEVSVRYGQIEHLLAMTIHRTVGLSYHVAVERVEELRSRNKVRENVKKCFKQWAIDKFGETEGSRRSKEFNALIEQWGSEGTLAGRRDDVIHCCWTVGEKDKQPRGTRNGQLLTVHGRPLGVRDIEKLADDLKHFVVQLNKATRPDLLSGPEDVIAAIPEKFTLNYIIPASSEIGVYVYATCAAAHVISPVGSVEPSDE